MKKEEIIVWGIDESVFLHIWFCHDNHFSQAICNFTYNADIVHNTVLNFTDALITLTEILN